MLSTIKQTDKQTNQCYQKHHLLCQGGNNPKSLKIEGELLCKLNLPNIGNPKNKHLWPCQLVQQLIAPLSN